MCYVMGGAELRDLVELLPEDIQQHITVSYSPCLGLCDKQDDRPPYVEINGKSISRVSKSNLLQFIKEEINHVI